MHTQPITHSAEGRGGDGVACALLDEDGHHEVEVCFHVALQQNEHLSEAHASVLRKGRSKRVTKLCHARGGK